MRYDKPLSIQITFYCRYPVVLFMLFWIFLVHCSLQGTVIFLIVSKEIQKYDQRKFYFFSKKKHFQISYSRSSLKKNCKKNVHFFSLHQKCKTKKFAISKNAKQKNLQ